jgi:hypothetical protein
MKQDHFEETLRKYLRSKPFHPFEVELVDGKVIVVEHPSLTMGGGAATIFTDHEFIEFACEEVRDIRHVPIPSI